MLAVERFDRRIAADGAVERIHQEDLLQALGIAPEERIGRAKYQRAGTAMPPSWWHAGDLLDSYADLPSKQARLLEAAVFTYLVGNADCHAKNLAFIIDNGAISLAPLYDIVPTALWPRLRRDLALSVADRTDPDTIDCASFVLEARRWAMSEVGARRVIDDLGDRVASTDIRHEALTDLVRQRTDRLFSTRT